MFYHDHALGITRLNVYAGTAAGYLLMDECGRSVDHQQRHSGGVGVCSAQYRYGIPLVIQDKTFVPTDIDTQDPKWNQWRTENSITWMVNGVAAGTTGDLWFPHIYEANQNPSDTANGGMNPFGRWDYGPWFWPPMGAIKTFSGRDSHGAHGKLPDVHHAGSLHGHAHRQRPAYPYLDVDPKAYRFRILNACNDRFLNLQIYMWPTRQSYGSRS